MIALDAVGAAQHGGVGAPTVPQELRDGEGDRQTNPGDRPEHGDADEAEDRQPELPALDAVDPFEIGDLEQADCRCNDDRSQRGAGQMPEEVRRQDKKKSDGERTDDAGQLGARAGCLRNGSARGAAADREALKEAGCEIGRAESDHLLVWVDVITQSRGIGSRKHAGVGK